MRFNNAIGISLFLIISAQLLCAQVYRCQVKINGLWGYVDEKGDVVIEAKYITNEPFSSDGVALVKRTQSSNWEMIDSHGNKIAFELGILNPKDSRFSEGMLPFKSKGAYGYLNSVGRVVIQAQYSEATPWSNGFGIVKRGNSYYVIDKTGNEKLVEENRIKKINPFSEGLASFRTSFGTEGFIDTDGHVAIQPRYIGVGQFNSGLAWVKNSSGLVSYINKEGKQAINIFFEVCKDFDPIAKAALVKENGQWKFLNDKGVRLDVISDYYGNFSHGLAYCKTSRGAGFINSHGLWEIQPQFRAVRSFKNGFAAASNLDYWGIIDITGNWVIHPKYQAIKDMEKID